LFESAKLSHLTPRQLVEERERGALILDARPAKKFASLHIRGAIQISLAGRFASWAALLLKPDQKLVIVAENRQDAEEAQTRLSRVGFQTILGYSLADVKQWRKEKIDLSSMPVKVCATVYSRLGHEPPFQLIDVRSRAEWLRGHLPGAISLPLLDLDSRLQLIDPAKPGLVYCQEGYRATTAASILRRETSADIGILIDGIEGWSASGLPLEVPQQERI
jgi:rhodanese-related sulfurtransferase